jgi:uncharacterized protein
MKMESKLEKKVKDYKEMPIVKRALNKLKTGLSEDLVYHSLLHTEDVISEVIFFATEDQLSEKDIELLVIAAVYHDYGFLVRYSENEIYGSDFAALAMEQSGAYSIEEIELVSKMILDTTIILTENGSKSVASTRLSGYLLDADLSNFGRDDFFEKLDLIAKEKNINSHVLCNSILKLLLNHEWNTAAAQMHRSEKKLYNLRKLESRIEQQKLEESAS